MKSLFATALIALVSSFALHASAASSPESVHDPIAIDPVNPAFQPVLKFEIGGGMPFPGGLVSHEITLTRTGVVNVHERRYGSEPNGAFTEKEYVLAQAEPADMLMIGQAIAKLRGGKLLKPNQPECADAPGFTYSAFKGLSEVTFYQVFNCIQQPLADKKQREIAQPLKNYLDQLEAMIKN